MSIWADRNFLDLPPSAKALAGLLSCGKLPVTWSGNGTRCPGAVAGRPEFSLSSNPSDFDLPFIRPNRARWNGDFGVSSADFPSVSLIGTSSSLSMTVLLIVGGKGATSMLESWKMRWADDRIRTTSKNSCTKSHNTWGKRWKKDFRTASSRCTLCGLLCVREW